MESELKDLNSRPPEPKSPAHVHHDEEGSTKDDRPLLKPDPAPAPSESIDELEKKFAAYVRRDAYGVMGRGELPLKEKVLLGLALVTLVPIRLVVATTILVFYYLICRVFTLFSAPNREDDQGQEDYAHMVGWKRAVIVRCGRSLSRVMLFVLGFYWISETYRISNPESNLTAEVLLIILLFFFSH